MKFAIFSPMLMLLSLSHGAAIDLNTPGVSLGDEHRTTDNDTASEPSISPPSTEEKRWTVSDPIKSGFGLDSRYTVTVISGIIMSRAQQHCMLESGENWAEAFASALMTYFAHDNPLVRDHLVYSLDCAFYPTSNTQNLYCTTLAVEFVFHTSFYARMCQTAARNYMRQGLATGSEINEPFPELSEAFSVTGNVTELGKRAVTCKNTCKFNFGTHDTAICHDGLSKIKHHKVECKV